MELIANAPQTVGVNQNVLMTDTVIGGNCSIVHREGSGLVSIRGLTRQCRARFRVSFGANVAIPEGGTVGPVSFAIAIDGEPVASTTMIETPAAVEEFNNIFTAVYVDVPNGSTQQVSVQNTGTGPAVVENANFIIERVA